MTFITFLTEMKNVSASKVGVQVSGSETEAVTLERNSTRLSAGRKGRGIWIVVMFREV
jgi:hypothetical protein